MGNFITYGNYHGTVDFSGEDKVFFGHIIGINDLVSYEGTSVEELEANFAEAVEDYLETCKELGKEANKSYRGVFNVRTSVVMHQYLGTTASKHNMKLNELANKAFLYLQQNEDKVLK
ncbi:MAG: type II toxin-antitoxin system HicB family antitoxin [Bacteroidota bacterium]